MERLGVDDYFREAFTLLAESGPDALTINALCARLGITKGSFYHHFGALPAFVAGLLEFWEREYGEGPSVSAKDHPDPVGRLAALTDGVVALPHAAEAALRAWARSDAEVEAAVVRVDKRRERQFVDAISALGIDRARARALARISMNVLVGMQLRERPADQRKARQVFDELNRLIEAGS